MVALALVLSVVQLVSGTRMQYGTELQMERVRRIQRMNDYPPSLYRLANILEARRENVWLSKIKSNFFMIFDFREPWSLILVVPILGFFGLTTRKEYLFLWMVLGIPVLVLTIIGPQKVGSYCLYPFLFICTLYAVLGLVKKK